jgi:hypothetical protein
MDVLSSGVVRGVLKSPCTTPLDNMPIRNILSTAAHRVTTQLQLINIIIIIIIIQLSISQKALGTLPEDGNVMPKHVGTTIHN